MLAVLQRLPIVDRQVSGDAQEPRHEGDAARLVARDRLECVEKGLGGQVFGENEIAGEEVSVAENPGLMTFIKAAECFSVAGDCKRYKLLVIGLCEDRPTHRPLLIVGLNMIREAPL